MYEAFWVLPIHLGIILILYLGVIQTIEIEILKHLSIPTGDHEHFFFVHNHKWPTLSSYVFSPEIKFSTVVLLNFLIRSWHPESRGYGANLLNNFEGTVIFH